MRLLLLVVGSDTIEPSRTSMIDLLIAHSLACSLEQADRKTPFTRDGRRRGGGRRGRGRGGLVHNGAGPANERAGQGAIESEQETTKTTRERDESKESESKGEESKRWESE